MFWRILGTFGAGSFFVVGWNVLTDPQCNTVSFRGGGARTVVTTCFPDSRGDFSKASAVAGSFLIGLAILAIIFWPLIRAYIAQIKFELSLKHMAQEVNEKQEGKNNESSTSSGESTQRDPNIPISLRSLSKNRLIAIGLIAVLVFGLYKIAAPKISLLNPITCSSLKKELAGKDVIGRQIWNAYQEEISNLSSVDSSAYYYQVGNVARRALQLNINDAEGYLLMKKKPHCVKDIARLDETIAATNTAIRYLQGIGTIDGEKFSVNNGWNANYYQTYSDFSIDIK